MRAWQTTSCLPSAKGWLGGLLAALVVVSFVKAPADAQTVQAKASKSTDPAVQFMEQVGRDLLAGARAKSPILLANAVKRYGDVTHIGQYSLGTYRAKLPQAHREIYHAGMVRFIGRYAASQAPKYPVVKYEIMSPSLQGGSGLMVDSRVTLRDGTTYDVRWLLAEVRQHLPGARRDGLRLLDDAVPEVAVRDLHRRERRQRERAGGDAEPLMPRQPPHPETRRPEMQTEDAGIGILRFVFGRPSAGIARLTCRDRP